MLRMARTAHQRDRAGESLPGRRRRAQLRRQRAAAARGAVQAALDPARGGRRRRRARRGAADLASALSSSRARSRPASDSDAGRLPRPGVHARARSRRSSRSTGASYQRLDRDDAARRASAELLADEKIIGWFNGRMEFGPRALGCRSILGDPRSPRMQAQMNIKIKFREGFRPFAPSVLRERVADYFELDGDSPYMLLVAPVKKERQIPMTDGSKKLWGIEQLNVRALRHSRRHAHRLLGAHPDGEPRDQSGLLRSDRGVRDADRVRRGGEHLVQRARRADRLHAGGRVPLLHADAHRLSRARAIPAREGGRRPNGRRRQNGRRNSSSTDRGRGPQVRAHRRRRVPGARRASRTWRGHARTAAVSRWRSAALSSLAALVVPTCWARWSAPGWGWRTPSRR